jgi:hypothetical protein
MKFLLGPGTTSLLLSAGQQKHRHSEARLTHECTNYVVVHGASGASAAGVQQQQGWLVHVPVGFICVGDGIVHHCSTV